VKDFNGKTVFSNEMSSDGKILNGYDILDCDEKMPHEMRANKIVDGKIAENVSVKTLYSESQRQASQESYCRMIGVSDKPTSAPPQTQSTGVKDGYRALGKFLSAKDVAKKNGTWKRTPASSVIRKNEGALTLFSDSNNVPLDGLINIELAKNVIASFNFKKGVPDGFCVVYCLIPHPFYLSHGFFKDGKPFLGSFCYLPDNGIELYYNLVYRGGRFEKFTHLSSELPPAPTPFVNEFDDAGRIKNGYDIVKIESPSKIRFLEYKDGNPQGEVDLNFFAKKGFDGTTAAAYLDALHKNAESSGKGMW